MPEQPREAKDERQDRKEARQQRINERVERAHAIMMDIRTRMTDEEYDAQLNALLERRRIMEELEDELRRHNELVARMTEAERAEYERISAMYDRNY